MRSFIFLFAALLTAAALAIDPPKPTVQEKPATPSVPAAERPDIADADKAAAAKAEVEAEADDVLPPLPDDMVPAGPPPARFNPTEKVRADFPVSFPIDI